MAVNDLYHLQVQMAIASKELSITLGYKQDSGDADLDVPQKLVDGWDTALSQKLKDCLATDVKLQCIYATVIPPATGAPGLFVYASGQTGSRSGFAIPAFSALVVKKLGTDASQRKNGRFYLPGISESDVSDGTFTSGLLDTPVKAFLDQLKLDLNASGGNQIFKLVIVNRVQNGAPINPPTANTLDDLVSSPIIYTQLKRKTQRTSQAS